MAKASAAQKTIRDLAKEQAAAIALRETLASMTDDVDAIRDTIEGETNLHEVIARIDELILSDECLLDGIKAAKSSLDTRKERVEKRIDFYRGAIEQAMLIAEIRDKLELPTGTISLKKVPSKLEVTEEAKIASTFFTQPDPVLNKKAVLDALKAWRDECDAAELEGRELPPCPVEGAELTAEGITLAIRRA